MPIYEYQCKQCGHQLEIIQKFSDEPLLECPKCHKPSLNKLISSTSFQLKGTGWYVTDTRDKGKSKKVEGEGAASSSSPTEAKSEDKKDSTDKKETKTSSDTSSNNSAAG